MKMYVVIFTRDFLSSTDKLIDSYWLKESDAYLRHEEIVRALTTLTPFIDTVQLAVIVREIEVK